MNSEPTPAEDAPDENSLIGHAVQLRRRPGRPPQRLFRISLVCFGAALVYLVHTAKVVDELQLGLGLLIVLLGFLPWLIWIKQARFELPIFETFIGTTVTAYGIPLISGHEQLQYYSSETITKAALCTVLFQIVAITTFGITRAKPKRSPMWRQNAVSGDISNFLGYGMMLSIAYTAADEFSSGIPGDIAGPIRAICFGLGIIATFVQCRRWGLGELSRYRKFSFVGQLTVMVILNLASLFLVQAISTLILALLGYVSGSKKVPVVVAGILLLIFAVLHQGKSTMRAKYWENGAPQPTLLQLPDFFGEWIVDGLEPAPKGEAPTAKASLLDRTSLIQLLCLVVSNTPERLPYLNGQTYAQIPGQFVPRFFWPEKPVGHISTYTLAVYYGLQRMEDTQKTTIGFGLLTEAYANFGLFGIILISSIFGRMMKKFCGWAADSPILSYPGLILIVLIAWSFQDELTLSIWLSSMCQAGAVVCAVPFLLNRFHS